MAVTRKLPFFILPDEIGEVIGCFLAKKEVEKASHTCTGAFSFFKEALIDKKLEELLQYVMNADLEKVETLLKSACFDCEYLILRKAHGVEFSGRRWKAVSPLEFATWSGNIAMIKNLLNYIPFYRYKEAVNQIRNTLRRKEPEENGKFLSPLILLIKTYKKFIRQFFENDRNTRWVEEIGSAQLLLPINLLLQFYNRNKKYQLDDILSNINTLGVSQALSELGKARFSSGEAIKTLIWPTTDLNFVVSTYLKIQTELRCIVKHLLDRSFIMEYEMPRHSPHRCTIL